MSARKRAFTLLECLVLLVVLGIVAAAAGRMLQAAPRAAAAAQITLRSGNVVMETLETLRARSFSQLFNVATGVSQPDSCYYDINGNAVAGTAAWTYQVNWSAVTGASLQLDASTTANNNIVRVTATLVAVQGRSDGGSMPSMSTYVSK